MDFLTGKIRTMYFKYLGAAFGSALISSIYGIVDMAMVGQYHGPEGSAAMAVVSPIWNIIYSLGLLMGIGGSVLFSTLRGESERNQKRSNEYFTAALIGIVLLSAVTWIAVVFFDRELLMLFGAEGNLLELARRYVLPIKFVVPSFLFTQLLSAFLRNDGNPGLATKAVLFGGLFNVFGDYFFVFVLDLGIMGAGIATGMGAVFSLLVMLSHFFRKDSTLYLVKPANLLSKLKTITVTGFSTYYFQALMKPAASFAVSVSRGALISGVLICLLPAVFCADSIWLAMPITELVVAVFVVNRMLRYTSQLPTGA